MSSEKRNQNNIINFPGSINQAVDDQQQAIVKVLITIQHKMVDNNTWHLATLTIPEIKTLSNYGEAMELTPIIAARLNAVLATTLLRQTVLEDLIWEKKEKVIVLWVKTLF